MSKRSRAVDRLQSLIHRQKQWVRSRLDDARCQCGHHVHRGFSLEPLEPRVFLSGEPMVVSFHVNNDDDQRSIVDSVEVQFSQNVSGSLGATDLMVRNVDTQLVVDASDIQVALNTPGDRATFTFPGLVGGSLADGNHTATLVAAGIQDASGRLLDGNGDGRGGDDYAFDLFRYFGDTQGDRDVDNAELFQLRRTFLETTGSDRFDPLFDHDGDNDVDNSDLFRFRRTFAAPLAADVTIEVSLNRDTAPDGLINTDKITSDPTVSGRVAFHEQAATVRAGRRGGPENEWVDITAALGVNGSFLLAPAQLALILGDTVADGGLGLTVQAQDTLGNVLANTDLSFILDTKRPQAVTPALSVAIASGTGRTRSFVDVTFDEAMGDRAFDAVNYAVVFSGGPNDGQAAAISMVERFDEFTARVHFGTALDDSQNYQLTVDAAVSDLAGNPLDAAHEREFFVGESFVFSDVSPSDGEQAVSLTRNAAIGFSEPVDPDTVTALSVQAVANGQSLPGRLIVNSTRLLATFIPETPWPSSTEVRIVVNGDLIRAQNGDRLDADGNGVSGGVAAIDFRTVSTARIAGTTVSGRVIRSEPGPGGEDLPLAGVTIRVDGFEGLFAVTDANGGFTLVDVPSPEFFVHIDG